MRGEITIDIRLYVVKNKEEEEEEGYIHFKGCVKYLAVHAGLNSLKRHVNMARV